MSSLSVPSGRPTNTQGSLAEVAPRLPGWFHTLDAFEAGPVAAYAAAEALRGLAIAVTGGSPPQAVLDAAREAVRLRDRP